MIRVWQVPKKDLLLLTTEHEVEEIDRIFAMNLVIELEDWIRGNGEFPLWEGGVWVGRTPQLS